MEAMYGGGAYSASAAGDSRHALRRRQKQVLEAMLREAVPLDASGAAMALQPQEDGSPPAVWRLLIFDDWGRDIVAPLLRVGDLRDLGVTLYMHIDTERDPVPGAPAVYLCAPTAANVARIAADCAQTLYEWVYVNFTAQVPRPLLEDLARRLAGSGLASVRHVKVVDRGLAYVALDSDLFSLMLPDSFHTLNRRGAGEAEVGAHLDAVVLGVFHVLLSLQALPVLVHSKTGAAEEVARRLTVLLNDALAERTLAPAPPGALGRPLLLLVDRSSDLASALHHPFTYRGLLVDIAGMRLNKCNVHGDDGSVDVLEVDPERDTFYRDNAGEPFGVVGGNIQAALRQYQDDYARLSQESGAGAGADATDAGAVSRLLAQAPLLAERKRCLDAHTKLSYNFLNTIRKNFLDSFHGVELAVLRREGLDVKEFRTLLEERRGTLEDRQRLYLVAYLMCAAGDAEEEVVRQMEATFDAQSFPALAYLKHLRRWSVDAAGAGGAAPGPHKASSGASAMEGFGWGFAQQIAKNIASTLTGTTETALPLTKVVDALLQGGSGAGGSGGGGGAGVSGVAGLAPGGGGGARQADTMRAKLLSTLVAFDPRTKRPVNLSETHFSQAIVFALGGGSVNEYDDLKRWEAGKPRKAVTYGCTALASGSEMLHQLSQLGAEAGS